MDGPEVCSTNVDGIVLSDLVPAHALEAFDTAQLPLRATVREEPHVMPNGKPRMHPLQWVHACQPMTDCAIQASSSLSKHAYPRVDCWAMPSHPSGRMSTIVGAMRHVLFSPLSPFRACRTIESRDCDPMRRGLHLHAGARSR